MKDWRLQGQEKYLKEKILTKKQYHPYSKEWDHDHCEFCGRKFSLNLGDLHEGYTTLDHYHWICEECFNDFKNDFAWVIIDGGIEREENHEKF